MIIENTERRSVFFDGRPAYAVVWKTDENQATDGEVP